MKTRFELEDEISQLYNFADQLNTLSEGILEHNLSNDIQDEQNKNRRAVLQHSR